MKEVLQRNINDFLIDCLQLSLYKEFIFNNRRNITLFEALKYFISVLKSHFVEG